MSMSRRGNEFDVLNIPSCSSISASTPTSNLHIGIGFGRLRSRVTKYLGSTLEQLQASCMEDKCRRHECESDEDVRRCGSRSSKGSLSISPLGSNTKINETQSQTTCNRSPSSCSSEQELGKSKRGWYPQLGSLFGFNKLDTTHTSTPVEDEQIRHHRDILDPVLRVQKDGYMTPGDNGCKKSTTCLSSCVLRDNCNNNNTSSSTNITLCCPKSPSSTSLSRKESFVDFAKRKNKELQEEEKLRQRQEEEEKLLRCQQEEERLRRQEEECEIKRRQQEEEECLRWHHQREIQCLRFQQEEEYALRLQEEERLRIEREAEECKRRQEEERLRCLREEEERRRRQEEEELLKLQAEECKRRQEEERLRRAAEECRRRKEEEEFRLRQVEEHMRREAEECRRRQEEKKGRRRQDEEECRRRQEEEECRRRQEEEECKRRQEEEESRRRQEEEECRRRQEEEECRRRQEEEECMRRQAEEEECRRRQEEEECRRRQAEEEYIRFQEEEECRLRQEEEECRRRQEEEECMRRQAEEQERLRQEQEYEEYRRLQEEECLRLQEEEARRCRQEQEEYLRRLKVYEECLKLHREEEEERARAFAQYSENLTENCSCINEPPPDIYSNTCGDNNNAIMCDVSHDMTNYAEKPPPMDNGCECQAEVVANDVRDHCCSHCNWEWESCPQPPPSCPSPKQPQAKACPEDRDSCFKKCADPFLEELDKCTIKLAEINQKLQECKIKGQDQNKCPKNRNSTQTICTPSPNPCPSSCAETPEGCDKDSGKKSKGLGCNATTFRASCVGCPDLNSNCGPPSKENASGWRPTCFKEPVPDPAPKPCRSSNQNDSYNPSRFQSPQRPPTRTIQLLDSNSKVVGESPLPPAQNFPRIPPHDSGCAPPGQNKLFRLMRAKSMQPKFNDCEDEDEEYEDEDCGCEDEEEEEDDECDCEEDEEGCEFKDNNLNKDSCPYPNPKPDGCKSKCQDKCKDPCPPPPPKQPDLNRKCFGNATGCDPNAIKNLQSSWDKWDRVASAKKGSCNSQCRKTPTCNKDPCNFAKYITNESVEEVVEEDDEDDYYLNDCCGYACDKDTCPVCGAHLDCNGCPVEEEEEEEEAGKCPPSEYDICHSQVFAKDCNGSIIYEGGMCIPRLEAYLWQTSDFNKYGDKNGVRRLAEATEFTGFGCKDCENSKESNPSEGRQHIGGMDMCQVQNFMWNKPVDASCDDTETECGKGK